MSKIIRAVNVMVSNPSKISAVRVNDKELYFLYNGKYKWSLNKRSTDQGEYSLHYYSGDESLDILAQLPEADFQHVEVVTYSTSELKTREARESFGELYRILQERIYGVDKVLDEIIEDSDEDF